MANAVDIALRIRNEQLERDLQKTQAAFARLRGKVEGDAEGMGQKLGASFRAGALAAAAALTSVAVVFKQTVQYVDELNTQAEQLGVSFQSFQELQYIAVQSDLKVESLVQTFGRLQVKIGELGTGDGKKFSETLDRIGVSADELRKATPEKQFDTIIAALGKIEDPAKRAAEGTEIFGRSFKQLNPLIEQGSDNLSRLREEAASSGMVISETARQALTEFDNAMNQLNLSTKVALAEAFTPLAIFLTNRMDPAIDRTRGLLGLLGDELLDLTADLQKAESGLQFYEDIWKGMNDTQGGGGIFSRETKKGLAEIVADARKAEQARDAAIDRAATEARKRGNVAGGPGSGTTRGLNILPSTAEAEEEGKKYGAALGKGIGEGFKKEAAWVSELEDARFDLQLAEAEAAGATFKDLEKMKLLQKGYTDAIAETIAQLRDQKRLLTEPNEAVKDFDNSNEILKFAMDTSTAIKDVGGMSQQTEDLLKEMGMMGVDAFEAIITKSQEAEEAIRNLIKELLILLAKKAILSAFGLEGGFGGAFGIGASTGRGASIRIFNNTDAQATARVRSDGSIDVNINAIAGAIVKGGNQIDAALRRTYGIQRQGF